MEPRAGTEGKAGQQSTRRAQNRESVFQALDRIRQAARQRKKERFTALFAESARELHPEPLTEPDVSLSTYPARATH